MFRGDGGGSVCRAYRSRGVDDGIDIGLGEQVGSHQPQGDSRDVDPVSFNDQRQPILRAPSQPGALGGCKGGYSITKGNLYRLTIGFFERGLCG